MAEKYDMPILYSCHPRSRNRLAISGFQFDSRVIQHEPLGFHDYNCLQMNAFAVVSDSGTLPEESSFFTSVGHPFPAVCIRTSTERPEAIDKGVRHMQTDDLRAYLTEYQEKHGSSRVTIDNIRRILSSFFSWLEDEDHILKSPVRRIHKV